MNLVGASAFPSCSGVMYNVLCYQINERERGAYVKKDEETIMTCGCVVQRSRMMRLCKTVSAGSSLVTTVHARVICDLTSHPWLSHVSRLLSIKYTRKKSVSEL